MSSSAPTTRRSRRSSTATPRSTSGRCCRRCACRPTPWPASVSTSRSATPRSRASTSSSRATPSSPASRRARSRRSATRFATCSRLPSCAGSASACWWPSGSRSTWVAIGPARRAQFRRASRRPSRPQVLVASFVGVLVVASTVLVALPEHGQGRPATSWVPAGAGVPRRAGRPGARPGRDRQRLGHRGQQGARAGCVGDVPRLGAVLRRARAASRDDRRPAADVGARRRRWSSPTVTTTSAWIRSPGPSPCGLTRSSLIDLGDDTSNGGSWETFSINSLAREFRGLPDRRGRRQPRPGHQRASTP